MEMHCGHCNKKFNKKTYEIKRVPNHFCSRKCKGLSQALTRIITKCSSCSKTLEVQRHALKKSKSGRSFCDKSCAASFNNQLKRKSRRSKCEIMLYEMLKNRFPNVAMMAGDKTMLNGYEVDIAIPSLNLAIEWNGIVHFLPIYGKDKLHRVQTNDQKKLSLAAEKGIELIVIPDLVSTPQRVKEAFIQIAKHIESISGR
jgi:hypothetical protein